MDERDDVCLPPLRQLFQPSPPRMVEGGPLEIWHKDHEEDDYLDIAQNSLKANHRIKEESPSKG